MSESVEQYTDGRLVLAPDPLIGSSYETDDDGGGFDQHQSLHERRMLEVHGYRAVDFKFACPRWLVGKACLEYDCVCRYSKVPGVEVWDHGRAWRHDGYKVITLEPYAVYEDDLADYRGVLAPLGLRIRVGRSSQWFRGLSHLLIIEPTPHE